MSTMLATAAHAGANGVLRLAISGELDFHSAPQLRAAVDELPLSADTQLVLDMSGLTFCDSSGITVLLAARKRALSHGATLALAAVPASVLKVFEITGLNQVFSMHPDPDAASPDLPA